MEPLDGEVRDRIRATSLWLVGALVLFGVGVGIYATFVGFEQVVAVHSSVVEVSSDGRAVTVQYLHGSCQEPAGVAVDEADDDVTLTAQVRERRPLRGQACTSIAIEARETVVLDAPLGERTIVDGAT